ncbi:MAG: cache domain-containing protein, partial [Campylobacteraceae bacterium]|nr:cache domain-containing protein [Campylobacteraceae bacterium]
MLSYEHKFLKFVKWSPILGIIFVSTILIAISIYSITDYSNKKTKQLEKDLKQQLIINSSESIIAIKNFSEDINLVIKDSFKRNAKLEVDNGFILLKEIWEQYKLYPKSKILLEIKKRLRNIRFFNSKNGYYFLYDKTGKVILLPIKPSLEGKNLWNYQDIKGTYIIQKSLKELQKNPNGVFKEWYYYLPNTNIIEKKLGYVKYFKKLDLMIGTAVYYTDINKEIKNKLFHILSKIKRDNSLLISILDNKGNVEYGKNGNETKKHIQDVKKILKSAKANPNKLVVRMPHDMHNTIQLVLYYKPLDFTIVGSIDTRELEKKIKKNKSDLDGTLNLVITEFLVAALLFIGFSILMSMYISSFIKKIFLNYGYSLVEAKNTAQKSLKAKSDFLANMSHEIRTPLNAMLGFIQILREKNFSKKDKIYLNIIEKSGENLLSIINDILDFSKIEAGKFNIEKISFNPQEDIRVIYGLFAAYASEKNILLKINSKNLDYKIVSDSTRIKQVISNLLSNAIKFTSRDKKIELNIKYDDKIQRLFVEVIDEGIGIPENKLDRIFQIFKQADNSTAK